MSSVYVFCDNCGASNRSLAKFCVVCGRSMSQPLQGALTNPLLQAISQNPANSVTGHLNTNILLAGRYMLEKLLGQGGMGAVYLVNDQRFAGAQRAIKELSQSGLNATEQQQAAETFEREALLLAQLNHPNLPRIYDHFSAQGRWYLVMDYIEGATLEDLLEQADQNRFSLEQSLQISLQLCNVLNYLHTRQPPVIFRDLKPANIMVTGEGHIYLIDFGIARLFKAGQAVDTKALGSPGYAAPEQYGKTQTTARTDIYSLGATLFQMLSGYDPTSDPFQFPELALPSMAGADELKTLVMSMVSLKRDERPADVMQIRQSLQKIMQDIHNPDASALQKSSIRGNPGHQSSIQHQGNTPGSLPASSTQPATNHSSTTELLVDKAGTGQHTSIGEAIQQARPHTRIIVLPGIYQESLLIDKPLEIVGRGQITQIVLESKNTCISMMADTATISGLTVKGQGSNGIEVTRGLLSLDNCTIVSGIKAGDGIGIVVHGSESNPTISNCTIYEWRTGIFIHTQAQATIENCTIYNTVQSGIAANQAVDIVIRRCKIYDIGWHAMNFYEQTQGLVEDCDIASTSQSALVIKQEANLTLRKCDIHDSQGNGIYILEKGQGVIEDCNVYNTADTGITASQSVNLTIRRCKIHDTRYHGMNFCKQALGLMEHCEIYNTGDNHAALTIWQEANPTIRKCDIHDCNNSGIYISDRGQGTIEDCTVSKTTKMGLSANQSINLTVRRCKFYNTATNGMHFYSEAQGLIENCEIYNTGETYPAVVIKQGANPNLRACSIHEAQSNGIWILEKGKGIIEDCKIFKNKLPGIHIDSESNPVIRRCKIYDGLQNGISISNRATGRIEACEFYGNVYPAVFISKEANPVISNCSFSASTGNGILVKDRGFGLIEDCEMKDLDLTLIWIENESNATFRRCKIHHGKKNGITIEKSIAVVENCEIYDNENSGINIQDGGAPEVIDCQIYGNKNYGIFIQSGGGGVVRRCSFANNGTWAYAAADYYDTKFYDSTK